MMTQRVQHRDQRRRHRGITLIEVMIAMVLGLILLAALSNVFISNMRTRAEVEKVGLQIENGRYAMQLLLDDISNAGYFGGASLADAVAAGNYCDINNADTKIVLPAIEQVEVALDCTPNHKVGTDIVVIRRFTTSLDAGGTACGVVPCVQVDKSGDPFFAIGETVMNKERYKEPGAPGGPVYAPVFHPVTHIYYVDTDNNLRRVWLKLDADPVVFVSEIVVDGIEALGFTLTGQSGRIDILARSAEGSQQLPVETKSYPAAFTATDGGVYTTNDNVRRQFYSATANIYNPI